MQRGPQFLILENRRHRSVGDVLATLWETDPPVQSIGLSDSPVWPKPHRPVPELFASFLLHFSIVFFLVRLPFLFLSVQPGAVTKAEDHYERHILYAIHPLALAEYLPVLKPKGPGGSPGRGHRPDMSPPRGGTAFHPSLTIISNPPHPDNTRQTILQMSSPPNLKIPKDIPLPNILVAGVAPAPPAQQPSPRVAPVRPAIANPAVPPMPVPPPLPVAPTLAIPIQSNPLPNPALAVAPLPPPSAGTESPKGKATSASAQAGAQAGTSGLLSLSVNPVPATGTITLPPGNRMGAFSVSPSGGGKEGSPGGVPGGDKQGGVGGQGAGGDVSTGAGTAHAGGGGGGNATASGSVSVSGSDNGGKDDLRSSFFASTLVYPVKPPPPRRSAVVVAAGPAGGGGLQVYGVLKGGRIYTIYLPMPGRSWILQFCAPSGSNSSQPRPSHGIEIRLDPGIVPPSAEEQFDFQRPPLSSSVVNEKQMVVLHGIIREDGSVGELKVLQGFLDVVDQAAVAAFSRWKFRPALRSNEPIAVEILVGIPMNLPGKQQ